MINTFPDQKNKIACQVLERLKLYLQNQIDISEEKKKTLYKFNAYYTGTLDRQSTLQDVYDFVINNERNLKYGRTRKIKNIVSKVFSKIDRIEETTINPS